jgi:hypothetical protein
VRRVNALKLESHTCSRRPHLVTNEFVIDGRPLLEHCEHSAGTTFDLVSPFGWTPPDYQKVVAQRLLLRQPPLLPSGRRELLVCPECADLGCGCISAVVQREDGYYTWRDFGYENDYDLNSLYLFGMGTLVFAEHDVARLLGGIVPGLIDSLG